MAARSPAQEPPAPADATVESEIRELRQLLEQQNRQLEALSRQFSALKDYVASSGGAPPTPPATPAAPPAGEAAAPAKTASAPAPSAAPANPTRPSAPTPSAAPAPGATGKHIVAKGETLTSIAKRYNISLAELEKANPIQNDRMLQIGQTLNLPASHAAAATSAPIPPKAPEPPTQKKENP